MPGKKPAKPIEEDFSDVDTLPSLNSLTFNLVLDFKNRERKDTLMAKIQEMFPETPSVKTITDEEIVEYGQGKQVMVEEGEEEDPEKRGKAAGMKMFSISVESRREKKAAHEAKIAEAQAAATEEDPNPDPGINPDDIDTLFYLPNFPNGDVEAIEMNSENQAVNLVLHIKEMPVFKPKEKADGEGEDPMEAEHFEDEMEEEQDY